MEILYNTSEPSQGVVFAEKERATAVAQIWSALNTAKTWGEFKAKMPVDEFRDMAENQDWGPEEFDEEAPFEKDDVPGFSDGDYPEWLQATMLDWFPEELIEKYGPTVNSVLNGPFLQLPTEKTEEIAADLRLLGYTVTKSDLYFY